MTSTQFIEIVINTSYGGFTVPRDLLIHVEAESQYDTSLKVRTHPTLVNYAKTNRSDLEVFKIPKDLFDASVSLGWHRFFQIDEYDGNESLTIRHDDFKSYKKEQGAKELLSSSELTNDDKVKKLKLLFGIIE
tara:strand:+ start:136 stop:534 length:399 start_codon:yes stop_codon:yes gene_type:complete